MQFIYKFPKGNSLTTYIEFQEKLDKDADLFNNNIICLPNLKIS